jgi:hypothetical protein
MNVRTTKKPRPRFDTTYISRLNMQSYGEDNLYPQNLQRITSASGTATTCLGRYAKFIEGDGMADGGDIAINRHSNVDDLLHDIAGDVASFGGFALHINYNVLGYPTEIQHIPFESCRLAEADSLGYVSHILVHPDWSGSRTRNGQRVRVTEKTVERFPVFNPDRNVVISQIAKVGGIQNYHGQIAWFSMAGRWVYPTPIYDAAITEISTDEGLGNIKYRNARNNFLTSCMLITKKGVPKIDPDSGREIETSMITDEDLRQFQGDENTSKMLVVELENDEDKPEVVSFPVTNYDKDFSVTDASVVERIYAQFHQELFHAIRIGKLGFSGDVMRDAYDYYAGEVTNEQRFIQRGLKAVTANMEGAAYDWRIKPLKYMNSEI